MGVHYNKADFITYGKPSLFLDFANKKSLTDRISGNNLITFTRSSTATYVGADGLIKTASADEPRFDHDPETLESLGLLVEESRANLYTQSSGMHSSYWGPINLITTSNATIAPDGTNTATLLVANTTNGAHYLKPNIGISTTFNTVSVFLKSNGDQYFMIRGDNQTNFCVFDLINGVITSSSTSNSTTASMIKYPNGWYRCIVSYIPGTTSNDPEFFLANSSTYNIASFSGTGANGVYIWGAQCEAGSFPTSYIPTSGSTETRSADEASITGSNFSSWYNQDQGTISFRAKSPTDPVQYTVVIDDSTNNNRHLFVISNFYQYQIRVSGSTEAQIDAASVLSSFNSIAGGYKTNDIAVALNGSVDVDNVASIPTCNRLSIYQFSGVTFTGTISRLTYWPKRLTDTSLQYLTQ